jgi:hypothetical protein
LTYSIVALCGGSAAPGESFLLSEPGFYLAAPVHDYALPLGEAGGSTVLLPPVAQCTGFDLVLFFDFSGGQ